MFPRDTKAPLGRKKLCAGQGKAGGRSKAATRLQIKVACDTEAVRDGVGARSQSDVLVPRSDICLWGMWSAGHAHARLRKRYTCAQPHSVFIMYSGKS